MELNPAFAALQEAMQEVLFCAGRQDGGRKIDDAEAAIKAAEKALLEANLAQSNVVRRPDTLIYGDHLAALLQAVKANDETQINKSLSPLQEYAERLRDIGERMKRGDFN